MTEHECKHGRLARKCDTCYLECEVQRLTDLNTDLEQEVERLKRQPNCFDCGHPLTEVRPGKHQCDWCEMMKENERLRGEINSLNCNSVECNYQRDIMESIYEAMAILPCNGIQGILCGAAQEIQALRDEVERLERLL